ncbi:hypothetical protein HMPREF9714_03034 [Myroides odoratimimus CCUG 12901]|uniref:hypothetical protein n=1 Tax=Myroides TaxID=76831 RepID=UPI000245FEEA|nr:MULTISPECIES: hypothetical protein [Myroides]EHO06258.1 hypothetical protein HMPREF9714_03034 [Myroides odoratimimus CCUG 12901]MCA4808042.1 hypothetical protein [Myroides odoratimimus]MCO7724838.1 hypothetical protein [Myroides odoratimimus]MDM1094965.1 hypothetical protein [Myroides odoratimimus]MDM1098328.1 hypothetical protein [Myroides odoratimimus]
MLTLLKYLLDIRFRKYVSKGDYIAMTLICGLYIGTAVLAYFNYAIVKGIFYFVFLDAILYHMSRTDIELLKVYKHYRIVLWFEYLLYSFPFLVVLIANQEYIGLGSVVVLYYLLSFIPKKQSTVVKYPFSLVDPFWRISFRKFKLLWILPIVILFSVMGVNHSNENLVIGSFILAGILTMIPTFERERETEIMTSVLSGGEYLEQQVKVQMFNSLLVIIPVLLLVLVLSFDWNYVFWGVLVLVLPMCNTVLKYRFYKSELKHQLFIASCFIGIGLPLLAMPFLYKRAIRQLNQIKNVESKY